MKNETKPTVELSFSSKYPEEAKKDIRLLLEKEFNVEISDRVPVRKDAGPWAIAIITFLLTSSPDLLIEYMRGLVKIAIQKFFDSPSKSSTITNYSGCQFIVNNINIYGKDETELKQSLQDEIAKLNNSVFQLCD